MSDMSSERHVCSGRTRAVDAPSHLSTCSRPCSRLSITQLGEVNSRKCRFLTRSTMDIYDQECLLYCSACPGGGAGVTGTWCFPASSAIRIGDASSGYSLRSRRSKVESVRCSTGSSNRKGRNGIVPRLFQSTARENVSHSIQDEKRVW